MIAWVRSEWRENEAIFLTLTLIGHFNNKFVLKPIKRCFITTLDDCTTFFEQGSTN